MEPQEREQLQQRLRDLRRESDGLYGTAAREADVGNGGPTQRLNGIQREIDQLQARRADDRPHPEPHTIAGTAAGDSAPDMTPKQTGAIPRERSAIEEIVAVIRDRLNQSRDRGMER